MYSSWAESQMEKMRKIFREARADHTNAVKTRVESVKDLGSVVEVTKNLFAVSKVRFDRSRAISENKERDILML